MILSTKIRGGAIRGIVWIALYFALSCISTINANAASSQKSEPKTESGPKENIRAEFDRLVGAGRIEEARRLLFRWRLSLPPEQLREYIRQLTEVEKGGGAAAVAPHPTDETKSAESEPTHPEKTALQPQPSKQKERPDKPKSGETTKDIRLQLVTRLKSLSLEGKTDQARRVLFDNRSLFTPEELNTLVSRISKVERTLAAQANDSSTSKEDTASTPTSTRQDTAVAAESPKAATHSNDTVPTFDHSDSIRVIEEYRRLIGVGRYDEARALLFDKRLMFEASVRNALIQELTASEKQRLSVSRARYDEPGKAADASMETGADTSLVATEIGEKESTSNDSTTGGLSDTATLADLLRSDFPEEFWAGFGASKSVHASDTAYLGLRLSRYTLLMSTGGHVDLSFGPRMNTVLPSFAKGNLQLGALFGNSLPILGIRNSPEGSVTFRLGLFRERTPLYYDLSYVGGGIFPIPDSDGDRFQAIERYQWSTDVSTIGGFAFRLGENVALNGYGRGNWWIPPTSIEPYAEKQSQVGGGGHLLLNPSRPWGVLVFFESIQSSFPRWELPGVTEWGSTTGGVEVQGSDADWGFRFGGTLEGIPDNAVGISIPLFLRKRTFSVNVTPQRYFGLDGMAGTSRLYSRGQASWTGLKGRFTIGLGFEGHWRDDQVVDRIVFADFVVSVWGNFARGKILSLTEDVRWEGYREVDYDDSLQAIESARAIESIIRGREFGEIRSPARDAPVAASAVRLGMVHHNQDYYKQSIAVEETVPDTGTLSREEFIHKLEHDYNMAFHEGRIKDARGIAYKLWKYTKDKWWHRQLRKLFEMPSENPEEHRPKHRPRKKRRSNTAEKFKEATEENDSGN